MQLIDIFLSFYDKILEFKILGYSMSTILFTITIVSIAFIMIHRMIKTKE